MLDENDFINEVWEKYSKLNISKRSKNNFFTKLIYKRNQKIIKLKTFILFLIYILTTSSVAYAGVSTYKIIQRNTYTNFQTIQGFDYNKDMIPSNNMYYKKLYSFQEYTEAQKIWDNLINMSEDDFKDSFAIVIAGENYNTTGMYISNIYINEPKLCIELRKKNEWNRYDTVISTKVSKELDKNQIELIKLPMNINTTGSYRNIELITKNYSIEDAFNDNCFVLNEKHQIISNNKEQFNNFVKNCNNKIEDILRITIFDTNRLVIYDLESKDNKINMLCKEIGGQNREYSFIGTELTMMERPTTAGGGYIYTLYNENKERKLICTVLY